MTRFFFKLFFILTIVSNSFASTSNYSCTGEGSRVKLKFDENKKIVISNNKKSNVYTIKNGITFWHTMNDNYENTSVVNSFYFQKATGKLAIDSHFFTYGYNKKYYMVCNKD